eukprot:CAMPEP_0172155710 /NCGR_PEP_ID=MMETSP1050-20130122/2781_1 /TAXON_ID=233186 /ORGANISM="Cryptomonas curvata, Strain CCAP979/52" /LENGTH=333 /DNA_ID=CAMNT_0012824647 /DNA_START=6 /DNA_END=1007 /DNA_ORIENTATION=+
MDNFVGHYQWSWSGGSFPVEFRPGGHFFSKDYESKSSTWKISGNVVTVDWNEYGVYEMKFSDNDSGVLFGSVLGHPSNRRTAKFVSKFTNAELLSFGVEGIGHVSATSPVVRNVQHDVQYDDRETSNASSSGWNDPDVMPTPSQYRAANTFSDPAQNGLSLDPTSASLQIKIVGAVERHDDQGKICTEYVVLCRFGSSEWHVQRRYNQFWELDQQLRKLLKKEFWGMLPSLPTAWPSLQLPGRQALFSLSKLQTQARKVQLEQYLCRLASLSKNAADTEARPDNEERERAFIHVFHALFLFIEFVKHRCKELPAKLGEDCRGSSWALDYCSVS